MSSNDIATQWENAFGAVPPLGSVCREQLGARWLRIHSLPESKRYPETDADRRELLRRHNDAATAVLGEGEECVLFVTTLAEDPVPAKVAATPIVWKRGFFDALIMSVAEEKSGPVLFANLARRAAYAPYDGGADLFVDTAERVALLKNQWRDWLSRRADGL